MKRTIVCLAALWMTLTLSARSVISLGLRGGFDFLLPKSEQTIHSKLGMAGAFDIGYTYYWSGLSADCGIHTGLSVGYAQNLTHVDFLQHYTNFDYMGNEMLYTTSGTFETALKRASLEVPIMAAFRNNGFVAKLGLKTQFALWSQSNQRLQNPSIDAYYVPYDVHVTDELITGVVPLESLEEQKCAGSAPQFSLLAAAQIGYEVTVGSKGRLGIVAYLDYSLWNTKSYTYKEQPLIAVAPITDVAYPVPTVAVNDVFTSAISRINPLQVGISIYYGIELEQQRYTHHSGRPRFVRSNMRYRPGYFRRWSSNRYRPYYIRNRR